MTGIIVSLKTAAPRAPGGAVRPVTEIGGAIREQRSSVTGSPCRPIKKSPGYLRISRNISIGNCSRAGIMRNGAIQAAGRRG